MPGHGLIDSNTGFAEDVHTGLIWLFGGLGSAGEDNPFLVQTAFQGAPLAFQANAFQILGGSADPFQANAFQTNAFQQTE